MLECPLSALGAGGNPARRVDRVNGFGVKYGEQWIYKSWNGRHSVIEFNNDGMVIGLRDVNGR